MTEGQWLRRFHVLVNAGGPEIRLDLLREYAAVRVHRPEGWDVAAVRAEAGFGKCSLECFCCLVRDRKTFWHHVIQIQHGGSNHGLNRVGICHPCHRRLHPWLPDLGANSRRGNLELLCDLMKAAGTVETWRRSEHEVADL